MGQNLTKITLCLVIKIQKVNNPGLDLDLVAVGQQHLDLDLFFLNFAQEARNSGQLGSGPQVW